MTLSASAPRHLQVRLGLRTHGSGWVISEGFSDDADALSEGRVMTVLGHVIRQSLTAELPDKIITAIGTDTAAVVAVRLVGPPPFFTTSARTPRRDGAEVTAS